MIKNRFFKRLSIFLIALFFVGALPWRELRADANIHGDYICDRLSVTYDQVSSWDLNTQGEFVITNISEETVDGWTIKFDFASDVAITSLWNGQDLRNETTPANTLIIGNEVYNSTINPGESVSFGLIMTGTEFAPVAPLNAELLIEEPVQEEVMVEPETVVEEQTVIDPSTCVIFAGSDITISGYRTTIHGDIYSGSDFNYQGSELSVDGIVRAESNVNVSGYSSVITGTDENALHVDMPDLSEDILTRENCSYSEESVDISTQTIEGETVIVSEGDITINVDTISEDSNITLYSVNGNITVNGNQAILNGTIYAPNGRVTFNANEITLVGKILANEFIFNGSVLNVTNNPEEIPEITPEPIVTVEPTVVPTATVTPTEVPTATPTVTVTPTDVPTATPTETATPTPLEEEEPTPTPTPEPVDETLDSDTDGIPDYLEIEIGTNPNDPDSDGDGLEDYLELMVGYDPTSQDTDNNGILDGEEDLDNDGLCNINELNLDTDIFSEDSDCDGLKDGEEVYTYGTDPKDPDSEDDGIFDGDEIELGKDPTDPSDATIRIEQTKIQEITNEEDPAITSVEVTMSLANSIDRSLEIRDMYNVDMYTTDVAGRIGSPISFECEEDFDTATVVIHYSEAALGDTAESDLGILWYDEENGIFVEQTQAILDSSNNMITMGLEHFSQYVLVDLAIWNGSSPVIYTSDDLSDEEEDGSRNVDLTLIVYMEDITTDEDKAIVIDYITDILSLLREGDRYSFVILGKNGYTYDVYSDCVFYDAGSGNGLPGDIRSQIMDFHGITREAWRTQFNSGRFTYEDVGNDFLSIYICSRSRNVYSDTSIKRGSATGASYTLWNTYLAAGALHNEDYYTNVNIQLENPDLLNDIRRFLGLEAFSWTDEDADGLPDVLEEEGMYATNGHTYFSDPETKHSDSDSLEDGVEMGEMVSIRRIDEDTVQFSRVDLVDIDDVAQSDYADLEEFIPEDIDEICFVFRVRSNPKKIDSDGDYYIDSTDSHPMSSDVSIINLGGGRYDPFVEHEYIGVYDHPSQGRTPTSYGGNQRWFGVDTGHWSDDLLEPGENHEYDNYIDPHGCGIIAYRDVSLYLENGISLYSYEEYYTLTHQAYHDLQLDRTPFGIYYGGICRELEIVGRNCGRSFEATWRTLDLDDTGRFLDDIKDMLNRNYPVIMAVNTIQGADEQLKYYSFSYNTGGHEIFADSGYSLWYDRQMAEGHYFTVTGLIRDYIKGDAYIRVSNAGYEQYIIFSEYVEYVKNHGVTPISRFNPGNAMIYFVEM